MIMTVKAKITIKIQSITQCFQVTKLPINTACNQVRFLCVTFASENLKEKSIIIHFQNQAVQLVDLVRQESRSLFYMFA